MRQAFPKVFILILISFFATAIAQAQLCQGSLGDPVINIDFGSGSANPGPALPAHVTNYGFVSNPCPSDGNYTISRMSSGCSGNSWHNFAQDHTGNTNGYCMVVNASYDPGDFYTDTVRGLCSNTTYEFAAWVINLTKRGCCEQQIDPDLTFSIETTGGNVLQSYNTGDVPATTQPQWKQYGFYFVTPAGLHDVVIRIRNNAPGGTGNDLALDDITFRPCGRQLSSYIDSSALSTREICEGNPLQVNMKAMVSNSNNPPFYQWQFSEDTGANWMDIPNANTLNCTAAFASTQSPGIYQFRLSIAEANSISCRTASNVITITIHPNPVIVTTGNTTLCAGDTLLLAVTGANTWQWKGPVGFAAGTAQVRINTIAAINAGKYYITATSDKSCHSTDSIIITVNPVPVANAGSNTTICQGQAATLQASGGTSYVWSPATGLSGTTASTVRATPKDTTTYVLTAKNSYGCMDTASVTVGILKPPTANAGPDRLIQEGESVQLPGSYTGTHATYYWSPALYLSNAQSLNPIASPINDTTYTLHVIADCGTAADNVFIKIYRPVIVPNIFSPNGDGIHDTWNIDALHYYPGAEVSVFSRYGALLFHSVNYPRAWDGTYNNKKLPAGTYYYIIDLKDNTPRISGSVTIL